MMSKEELRIKYLELKEQLGKKPNLRDFRSKTKTSDKDLASAFGRNAYSKLVEYCGDSPNQFGMKKSELTDVLERWGALTREIGLIPNHYEWEDSGNKPTVSGIARSHELKWSEIPNKFVEVFQGDPSWNDVIQIIGTTTKEGSESENLSDSECFVYLMKDNRNNAFKIGISNDAIFREKTLQSEQPKIELIARKKFVNRKIAGAIEKALHNVYQHKHLRGEWFRLDSEDLNELLKTLND